MKNYKYLLLLPFFFSCVKDKPNNPSEPEPSTISFKKVLVVNEGNFMSGNASVSLYDPNVASVVEDFYKSKNNTTLGDVAQSISYFNSQYYIVVNNSGKIMVCDNDLKIKASILSLNSPRYILPIGNAKAYVSDLFSNFIHVLNLNTNQVTSTIPCAGWTEKMVAIYSKAFITNTKRNYTYVINTVNDTKSDSVFVGPNAGSILIDKNDKVWVLSAGNFTGGITPSLSRINPTDNSIEKVYQFAQSDSPGNLCINKTKDTLYYLNNGIYRMSISDMTLPVTAFVLKGTRNYYGLGVNPGNYTLYASDALDYVSKSNIYIFDMNGTEKSFFKAGINANSFYFE